MVRRRVAVFGDIHLGALAKIVPGGGVAEQLLAFRRGLERCVELEIEEVVQAGDLFHTSTPDDDIRIELANLLREFEGKIRFWLLPGNHDRPLIDKHNMKWYRWLGQNKMMRLRVVLRPRTLELAGIPIWLCPHPYIDDQPADAAISVGHFAWTGARRENGSAETGGHRPSGNWVLADFHEPQRGPRFHYVGSLTQTKWDEAPVPRGFSVIQADRVGTVSVVRIPVEQPYRLERLEIEHLDDLEQIDPLSDTNFYRLLVHSGVSLPPDWQRQMPTVIDTRPVGQTERGRANIERVNMSDDPMDGLPDWLKQRGNLTVKQSDWVVSYLQTALKRGKASVSPKHQAAQTCGEE